MVDVSELTPITPDPQGNQITYLSSNTRGGVVGRLEGKKNSYDCVFARAGEIVYRRGNGEIYKEIITGGSLCDADSMGSLKGVPVIIIYEDDQYKVHEDTCGVVVSVDFDINYNNLYGSIVITDEVACDRIDKFLEAEQPSISCAYECNMKVQKGVGLDDVAYQIDRKYSAARIIIPGKERMVLKEGLSILSETRDYEF